MSDLFRVDGKVALITGAGRGLGRAMAVGLAEAGADCVLVARREADLACTARGVQDAGRRAVIVPGDVTDPEVAPRAVAAGLEAFGRVDLLVNNAGAYDMQPIHEYADDDWQRLLDVNLMAPFRFAKAIGPHLLERGSGKVVNIASVLGTFGVGTATAYCTSKAGIMGFTRSLAVEWAPHGIQVNALAPGLFNTDMSVAVFDDQAVLDSLLAGIPKGRAGEPGDIVGTAVYLCSPASDHVVGQVLHVDGGVTIA